MNQVRQIDLNGMLLCLDPYPSTEIVSVGVFLGGPIYAENPGEYGFAALLMDFLRTGGGSTSEADLQNYFEQNGNGLRSFCTHSQMGIYFRCWPKNWEQTFGWLAKVFSANFSDDRLFQREKKRRISLLREEKDHLASFGLRLARERFFAGDALSCSPTGKEEDLQSCDLPGLASFFTKAYRASQWIVSVSGKFQDEELVRAATAFRNSLSFLPQHVSAREKACPLRGCGSYRKTVPREQALYCLLIPAGGLISAHRTKIKILVEYFNGLSGPLFEEIREKKGLAYYAYASWIPSFHDGCLAFTVGCEASKLSLVQESLQQEWEKVCRKVLPDEHWRRAVIQRGSFLRLSRQKTDWRCSFNAAQLRYGRMPDLGESELAELEQLTPQALLDYTTKLPSPDQFLELQVAKTLP